MWSVDIYIYIVKLTEPRIRVDGVWKYEGQVARWMMKFLIFIYMRSYLLIQSSFVFASVWRLRAIKAVLEAT
jgi:hypothetical protein